MQFRLVKGEVKAESLLSEPQILLTDQQRASRAKVHKDPEPLVRSDGFRWLWFIIGENDQEVAVIIRKRFPIAATNE